MDKKLSDLIEQAKQASEKCYAPYSNFPVGCVLEAESGEFFTGCNVENISFGLTNCAERTAVFKAVSELGPEMKIKKIVIYTPTPKPVSPCGACRQVLQEFSEDLEVISACLSDDILRTYLNELLPNPPEISLGSSESDS